jgi:rhodanese-related sulfurtransferase
MKLKVVGALVAVAAATGLLLKGQPTLEDKLQARAPELEARLKAREVQIDPAELLDVLNNYNTGLRILDVRDEADYNLFHIVDSVRVTPGQIRDPAWVRTLPAETVFVLVSNDEQRAAGAWKLLAVQNVPNLYLLAGGINAWLDLYSGKPAKAGVPGDAVAGGRADDHLRHRFSAALGSRHPAADPDPHLAPRPEYVKKVKSIGPAGRKAGGCG